MPRGKCGQSLAGLDLSCVSCMFDDCMDVELRTCFIFPFSGDEDMYRVLISNYEDRQKVGTSASY